MFVQIMASWPHLKVLRGLSKSGQSHKEFNVNTCIAHPYCLQEHLSSLHREVLIRYLKQYVRSMYRLLDTLPLLTVYPEVFVVYKFHGFRG